MKQRIGGIVFAILVGLAVAILSYRWIADPRPGEERQREERAVLAARNLLQDVVAAGPLEIVDPLAPDRRVGKAYIYPGGPGWEVSGFYRRDDSDLWHPYLLQLNADLTLSRLKLSDQDTTLIERAKHDPQLEVLP